MRHELIILIGVLFLVTSCSKENKVEPQQNEMAKRMEKRRKEILQNNTDVKQYYQDNYIIMKDDRLFYPGDTISDFAREYNLSEIDIRLLNGFGPDKITVPPAGILVPIPREADDAEKITREFSKIINGSNPEIEKAIPEFFVIGEPSEKYEPIFQMANRTIPKETETYYYYWYRNVKPIAEGDATFCVTVDNENQKIKSVHIPLIKFQH